MITNSTRSGNFRKGEAHYAWKGDDARTTTKRERAQRMFPLEPCEVCGSEISERHHVDGDPGNNVPGNIAFLCRRHHMQADGRLEALRTYIKPTKPPEPCVNCGDLVRRRTHGRCHACDMYFRRHGAERPESFPPATHCPKGHAYDEANTYVSKKGARYCRTCNRENARRYRAERKGAA